MKCYFAEDSHVMHILVALTKIHLRKFKQLAGHIFVLKNSCTLAGRASTFTRIMAIMAITRNMYYLGISLGQL